MGKGCLVSEVRWEDLVCVIIDDRHGDARVRQPNLYLVVSSRQGRKRDKGVPSRERLVCPVSLVSPQGVESSIMHRQVRC